MMKTRGTGRLTLAAIVVFGTAAAGEDRAIPCPTPGPCGATTLGGPGRAFQPTATPRFLHPRVGPGPL